MQKEEQTVEWNPVDKDQLGYESNFNPHTPYHKGPRVIDNQTSNSMRSAD